MTFFAAQPNIPANGHAVNLYTLTNHHGMKVKITNYGGVVQSIWVPDRHGRLANVALGFSTLDDYVNDFQHQPWPASGGSGDTYFGAIIGRYANRIAGAQFTLNGHTYPLGSGPPCPTTWTPSTPRSPTRRSPSGLLLATRPVPQAFGQA